MIPHKMYLGDGVYGVFDPESGDVVLTIDVGIGEDTHTIVLQVATLENLMYWLDMIREESHGGKEQ